LISHHESANQTRGKWLFDTRGSCPTITGLMTPLQITGSLCSHRVLYTACPLTNR